jgi:hypothetical protein
MRFTRPEISGLVNATNAITAVAILVTSSKDKRDTPARFA